MGMSQDIYNIIKKVADEFGVPAEVWYPIAMHESGGNPNAHNNKGEDSRGLFQVNVPYHPKANSSQLFNPEYNARYMMPTLARVYEQGKAKGLTGLDLTLYVEKHGERPKWTQGVINSITKHYNEYTGGNFKPSDTEVTPQKTTTETTPQGDFINIPLVGDIDISGVKQSLSLTLYNIFIFIIIIFALYITFVSKGGKQVGN